METTPFDSQSILRIGKKVPQTGANLAYVSSPSISPQDNLAVEDYSAQVPENTVGAPAVSYLARPDDDFLLRYLGGTQFQDDNLQITDEFSVIYSNDQTPEPLYYKATLRKTFDVTGVTELAPYTSGYSERTISDIKRDYALDKTKAMVYIGNKISIKLSDGTALPSTYKYKVILTPLNGANSGECYVAIYTNFRSVDETYVVTYQSYSDSTVSTTEIINPQPFFGRVDLSDIQTWAADKRPSGTWRSELSNKVYSVEALANHTYQVYAPSQIIVADNADRPIQTFKYQVEANLNVTYGIDNPADMNIGFYFNDTYNDVSGSLEDVDTVMENLQSVVPSYLTLNNPNPPSTNPDKLDHKHWSIEISQPGDILKKYDVILIGGYGALDLTYYGQNLIDYIEAGGKVWIDSCSNGSAALTLTNWPVGSPTSVNFDTANAASGYVCVADSDSEFLNRYWTLPTTTVSTNTKIDLGYVEEAGPVGAKILIGDETGWNTIARWSNASQDIAIISKKIGNGTLIISNCGVMRAGSINNVVATKFMANTILALAEDVWIKTPKIVEQVIHINDLFPQEYKQNGTILYYDDYLVSGSSTLVAKKILAQTTRSAMLPYMPHKYQNGVGTFKISVYNLDGTANQNVTMTSANDGSSQLWVCSLVPGNRTFSLGGTGLDDLDVTVFYPDVEFKWALTAYTYEWDNVSQYRYVEGNTYEGTATISSNKGRLAIGDLISLIPPTPQGSTWANRSKVFYSLWLGYKQNGLHVPSSLPVNLAFYNSSTGEYIYDLTGENRINWSYLFTEDELENISIHAWTNYYTLRASKRTFSIQVKQDQRIFPTAPVTEDERDCWFPRVNNGSFSRNYYYNNDHSLTPQRCFYSIPEYHRQHFNPAEPWMKVEDDRAIYVDDHKIRVNNGNLYLSSPSPFSAITVIRRNYSNGTVYREKLAKQVDGFTFKTAGTEQARHKNLMSSPAPILYLAEPGGIYNPIPVNAYTTNYEDGIFTMKASLPDTVCATYRYSEDETLTVVDVDIVNGIIRVSEEVDFTDEIFVDYQYEEKFYTYKGYWDGATFWYLDLNPSEGHFITYPVGIEVTTGTYISTPKLIPTSELINKSIFLYLLPYKVDGDVTTNWPIRHAFSAEELALVLKANPRALHLATIQIREKAKVDDVVVLDSRVRGGGLKTSVNTERIKIVQPLSQHYWDIGPWDGIAYQSNGVIIVRLPKRLSTEMTEAQVRDAISKFLPYGVFPIIEYVDKVTASGTGDAVFLLPFMLGGE